MDEKRSSIEKACKEILKDFEGILKWKWDDWFEALLAEFTLQTQDKPVFDSCRFIFFNFRENL